MTAAFVSGGTGGIGEAVVRRLHRAGCRTAIGYNSSGDRASALASELAASRGEAFPVFCDCAAAGSADAAVQAVCERFGQLDLLVNCAGVSHWGLFDETTDAAWRRLTGVNLDGVFRLCRAAVRAMLPRKSGAIINIGSVWGETGASCEVAYAATKAGVAGLTKALAKELAPAGITVNCVSPGAVDTAMLSRFSEAERAALCAEIPLGRLAKPDEIADAVYFLANARYITGQILGVNGGLYI